MQHIRIRNAARKHAGCIKKTQGAAQETQDAAHEMQDAPQKTQDAAQEMQDAAGVAILHHPSSCAINERGVDRKEEETVTIRIAKDSTMEAPAPKSKKVFFSW